MMQPQVQLNLDQEGIYIFSDVFTSYQDVFGLFSGHLIYKVLFPDAFSVNLTRTGHQIHRRSKLYCVRELNQLEVTPPNT